MALQALYGEMSQIVMASQRVEPVIAQRAGYVFRYSDLLPALQNLLGPRVNGTAFPRRGSDSGKGSVRMRAMASADGAARSRSQSWPGG